MRHQESLKAKSTRRRLLIGISTLVLAASVAACGGSDDKAAESSGSTDASIAAATPPASGSSVTIKTFAFVPSPIKVKAGDTVTWSNEDDILHTVTSGKRGDADGMFDEKLDGPGSKATFTFSTPGTFAYHCSIHPGMDATVAVG